MLIIQFKNLNTVFIVKKKHNYKLLNTRSEAGVFCSSVEDSA